MSIDPKQLHAAEPLFISKARRLSRRRGLSRSDFEDIGQDLRTHLIQQAAKFDPTITTWEQFVSYISDKRGISFLRYVFAEKRSPLREECSLNDPVLDGDGRVVERHQTTPEASRTWQRLYELKRDVADVRATLPTELHRQIMDALARGATINSIAVEFGISRRAAERHIGDIRQVFEDASLRDYL
ncbi:MAG: hypothetical protein IT435_11050 [Phycisphaerales bacterium]|nr:hypothetical protein [Phycisphaerales bacterium]